MGANRWSGPPTPPKKSNKLFRVNCTWSQSEPVPKPNLKRLNLTNLILFAELTSKLSEHIVHAFILHSILYFCHHLYYIIYIFAITYINQFSTFSWIHWNYRIAASYTYGLHHFGSWVSDWMAKAEQVWLLRRKRFFSHCRCKSITRYVCMIM